MFLDYGDPLGYCRNVRFRDSVSVSVSEHVSGAENGAERAENRVSGSGAVSGHSIKHLSVRPRSRDRAKSAEQSPLTPKVSPISDILT